jgi:hypothetical protein
MRSHEKNICRDGKILKGGTAVKPMKLRIEFEGTDVTDERSWHVYSQEGDEKPVILPQEPVEVKEINIAVTQWNPT